MKLVTFIYKNKQKIGHLYSDIDKCDNNKGYVIDISTYFDYTDMLDFIMQLLYELVMDNKKLIKKGGQMANHNLPQDILQKVN